MISQSFPLEVGWWLSDGPHTFQMTACKHVVFQRQTSIFQKNYYINNNWILNIMRARSLAICGII